MAPSVRILGRIRKLQNIVRMARSISTKKKKKTEHDLSVGMAYGLTSVMIAVITSDS